jgi:hypothetical protein
MLFLPVEDNFYDEYGKSLKLTIVRDYIRHMGSVDKSESMMNSYSGNGPWTEKLFLYLLEFTFSIAL